MTAVLNISIYTFGPALLFRPGVNTFKPARSSGLFQVNLAHNKDQATKEIIRLRIEINPRKDCCGLSLALFIPLSQLFLESQSQDITSLDGGGRDDRQSFG